MEMVALVELGRPKPPGTANIEPVSKTKKRPQCKECFRTYASNSDLKKHMVRHSVKKFKCDLCHKWFHTKCGLERHGSFHSEEKKYECSEPNCGQRFKSEGGLKGHKRRAHTHTGEKPFSCDICGRAFTENSNLRSHKMTVHSDAKPFSCTFCNYTCNLKPNMARHITQVHAKEKRVECSDCGTMFGSSTELIRHSAVHFNRHVCPDPDCGREYRSSVTLFRHRVTHSNRKCTECNKGFGNITGLEIHMRIHTGEKPYACQFCTRAFASSGEMNVHIRRVHTGERQYSCGQCRKTFVDASGLKGHEKTHNTNRQRLPCDFCDKSFIKNASKKMHMRTHLNEKPYKCDECDYASVDSSKIPRHKNSMHKSK